MMRLESLEEIRAWIATWWAKAGWEMTNVEQGLPPEDIDWDADWYRAHSLPADIEGVSLQPIRDLISAIKANAEPGAIHGPRLCREEMQIASSEAMKTKIFLDELASAKKRAHHPKKTMPIDSDVADVCNRIADAGDDANVTQICREVAKLRQRDSGTLRNAYYRWKKKQP